MSFEQAFQRVLVAEGGYSLDERDPGGETKYGISKRAYPDLDIARLTLTDAHAIYKRDYWDPCRCDQLPEPIDELVFDCAVNQGVGVAVKLLQKAINVPQDGVIGNNTMAAIKKADRKELAALYLADRALRYTGTRNFDVYGRGWMKRLFVLAREVNYGA